MLRLGSATVLSERRAPEPGSLATCIEYYFAQRPLKHCLGLRADDAIGIHVRDSRKLMAASSGLLTEIAIYARWPISRLREIFLQGASVFSTVIKFQHRRTPCDGLVQLIEGRREPLYDACFDFLRL